MVSSSYGRYCRILSNTSAKRKTLFDRQVLTKGISKSMMVHKPLISTLPLQARISTFLIISDIHATFGHNVSPRHCPMMYSEPLGIYTMSFRSFLTSYDLFRHFSMFLCCFRPLLACIGLVSTSMDYLCIPHTIAYLSDVFPTLSDLFQSLFIFALIDVPMFWLFLIVDRFH
jgi:hypothetical protein